MTEPLKCWRCGASLEHLSLPLARRDECAECGAELHVCKQCSYFDAAVSRACREDDAQDVKTKDRANFCDYFKPSATAYVPGFTAAHARAQAQLASLFGDPSGRAASAPADTPADGGDDAGTPLDALFKD